MSAHSTNPVLPGSYNYLEVAVSVLIAISGSYVALFLAERLNAARHRTRWAWLGGGALVLGIGIWAMHFTGMLAFSLPVPVAYYWPTVLGSLVVAACASAAGLFLVSRTTMSRRRAVAAGLCIGAGIAGLHYMDMAAMRMPADTSYNPVVVALSVVFAVVFSLASLWLTFYFRQQRAGVAWQKVGAALAMGAAISTMHYTGMASATFTASNTPPDISYAVPVSALSAAGIASVTMLVLALAMVSSLVDRRFDAQGLELALAEARLELARLGRAATMGELTASIAHEINQPLGAVVTYAGACLRWLTAHPPNLEEAREATRRSIAEANRASEVIARIRSVLQKSPPQKAYLEVNDLIREVLGLIENEFVKGKVTLQADLAPDNPAVLGDRVELQQVMVNLIMNAIEAMSTTNHQRRLYVRSKSSATGVHVQVQDTGRGISASDERMFEPFFTTKEDGMGMGLSISRSIIDAHGGRLWATPGCSCGAVFEFVLPKATHNERAA